MARRKGGTASGGKSVWAGVVRVGKGMEKLGIELSSSFGKEVGDGEETNFWSDRWASGESLRKKFARLWYFETTREVKMAERRRWEGEEWTCCWDWRREPKGRELGEFANLVSLL